MGGFSTIGAVAPILSGKVVTGSNGTATITFPARATKPQVLLMPEADGVVAAVVGWVTDAGGNYTGVVIRTYYHVPSVSKTTESVVKSVSVSTGTVLSDVTPSTGTFVTGISVDRRNFTTASAVTGVSTSTGTFVTGVSVSTGTFVRSIPSTTGDAAGRYSVDSSGVVHHDHPIGSPTTGTAVTGVTPSTGTAVTGVSTSTGTFVTGITTTAGTTVVANVTPSTGTAVTGISKSTATVVTGVTSSATSVLSDVALSASPAANVTVHYVIV
ncbi:MAG: hypothetical protein QXG54_05185 [Desulfurococcaceae archaeon]